MHRLPLLFALLHIVVPYGLRWVGPLFIFLQVGVLVLGASLTERFSWMKPARWRAPVGAGLMGYALAYIGIAQVERLCGSDRVSR